LCRVVAEEQFDAISDYIITKPSLAHKLISLNAFGWTVLGYPVYVQHAKYHRNALLFNLCFVFEHVENYATSPLVSFEPIVRKFAAVLTTLEHESEFLFRALFLEHDAAPAPPLLSASVDEITSNVFGDADDRPLSRRSLPPPSSSASGRRSSASTTANTTAANSINNPASPSVPSRSNNASTTNTAPSTPAGGVVGAATPAVGSTVFARLASLIDSVFIGLNSSGSVQIDVDDANVLALRLFPSYLEDTTVLEHHVPVRIQPLEMLINKHWDLTLLRITPFINGVYHAKKIATEANVNLSLVLRSLALLVHYRIVKLVDIFQYSNVYMPTKHVNRLYTNVSLQRECVHFVTLTPKQRDAEQFTWQDVFRIYCVLRPPRTMRDLCLTQPLLGTSIDERKLITFGILHGLIRRIHACPFADDTKQSGRGDGAVLHHHVVVARAPRAPVARRTDVVRRHLLHTPVAERRHSHRIARGTSSRSSIVQVKKITIRRSML
jgi:hypothetical protein